MNSGPGPPLNTVALSNFRLLRGDPIKFFLYFIDGKTIPPPSARLLNHPVDATKTRPVTSPW